MKCYSLITSLKKGNYTSNRVYDFHMNTLNVIPYKKCLKSKAGNERLSWMTLLAVEGQMIRYLKEYDDIVHSFVQKKANGMFPVNFKELLL